MQAPLVSTEAANTEGLPEVQKLCVERGAEMKISKQIEIDTRPAIVRAIQEARCNGGSYTGDELPIYRTWQRPADSWLATRRAELAGDA